jgi:hypothetical protein
MHRKAKHCSDGSSWPANIIQADAQKRHTGTEDTQEGQHAWQAVQQYSSNWQVCNSMSTLTRHTKARYCGKVQHKKSNTTTVRVTSSVLLAQLRTVQADSICRPTQHTLNPRKTAGINTGHTQRTPSRQLDSAEGPLGAR